MIQRKMLCSICSPRVSAKFGRSKRLGSPESGFCHYAPYDFMMKKPGTPKEGVPVPLYNLVYHDCVIQPWMMDKVSEAEDYMLYALLNGGAPYLIRDAAYPNIDGAFDDNVTLSRKKKSNVARQ